MVAEWDEYFDWEITQWTKAIMGAIPAAKKIESDSDNIIRDPAQKAAVFDLIRDIQKKAK